MKRDNVKWTKGVQKTICTFLFLLSASSVLTGCKPETAEESLASAAKPQETEAGKQEEPNWKELTLTAEGSAKRMVEAGGYLFFFYKDAIYCMNEKTGEKKQLRAFEKEESSGAFWVYRGGLYFDSKKKETEKNADDHGLRGLYRLDLTSGAEEHLADIKIWPRAIYASEDKLYVKGFDEMNMVYQLDSAGRTKGELSLTDTVYGRIPDGCFEVFSGILPYYAEHYGYLPVQNADCLVIADTEGGNLREITEISNTSSVLFAEDCFFALFRDGNGKTQCWRYETASLDKTLIFESETNPDLLQFADGMLYYAENRTPNLAGGKIEFYQVSAEEKQEISVPKKVFSIKEEAGMIGSCNNYGNFYVTEAAVYGQQFHCAEIYMGKADKDGGQVQLLEPALYQSPLKALGHAEGTAEELPCPCGAVTAAQLYLETLVFDGDSEAVLKMNQIIKERKMELEEEVREEVSYLEEEEIHWRAEAGSPYAETYVLPGQDAITYQSERYICIRMDGYEYSGGAHGFPFRDYFVFDRQTGERLTLADLIEIPVEELQKKAGLAFRTLAEETSFSFEAPEDLEFTVADSISYDSDFYLTENGIAFYYYPYVIAPYAAGFPEVILPYEELELKIDLETGK